MSILDNEEEDTYLREISLAAMLSWVPSPSWWQRLALLSFREKSQNVGALIYMVLQRNAKNTDPLFTKE